MIAGTPLCKALLFMLPLAGASPDAPDTQTVKVDIPAGAVTCQLYTRILVVRDRAFNRPPSMSVSTADGICVYEG